MQKDWTHLKGLSEEGIGFPIAEEKTASLGKRSHKHLKNNY